MRRNKGWVIATQAKDMPKRQQLEIWSVHAAALSALLCTAAQAAELRGVVTVEQAGMFSDRGETIRNLPVSVALYPAEAQGLPRVAAREHVFSVAGSRIAPLYLAVQQGDRVRFENQDDVYHQLFTHSKTHPVRLDLDRDGFGSSAMTALNEVDNLHWFCHIHAKTYARIDVLDTPYIQMIKPGETFEFRDLPAGTWRLRVAAPGTEVRMLEAEAVTAPPPMQIRLAVKGFSQEARGTVPAQSVAVEQLFPNRPGL